MGKLLHGLDYGADLIDAEQGFIDCMGDFFKKKVLNANTIYKILKSGCQPQIITQINTVKPITWHIFGCSCNVVFVLNLARPESKCDRLKIHALFNRIKYHPWSPLNP